MSDKKKATPKPKEVKEVLIYRPSESEKEKRVVKLSDINNGK